MGNPTPYRIIAVAAGRVHEARPAAKAPSTYQMAQVGELRKADFVIRYFPSRKAWRVLDVRNRRKISPAGRPAFWDPGSIPYVDKLFPSEDAAVMWAMHHCGQSPEI